MDVELAHVFEREGRYSVSCILETSRRGGHWPFWEGRAQSNTISITVLSDAGEVAPAITLSPDLRKSFATPAGQFIVCLRGSGWALRAYFALGAFPHTTGDLPLKRTLVPVRCKFYRGPYLERYVGPPQGPASRPVPSSTEYSVQDVAGLEVTIVAKERTREPESSVHVTLSDFTVGEEKFAGLGPVRLSLRGPYP